MIKYFEVGGIILYYCGAHESLEFFENMGEPQEQTLEQEMQQWDRSGCDGEWCPSQGKRWALKHFIWEKAENRSFSGGLCERRVKPCEIDFRLN